MGWSSRAWVPHTVVMLEHWCSGLPRLREHGQHNDPPHLRSHLLRPDALWYNCGRMSTETLSKDLPSDLHERLLRVRDAAYRIWAQPRLHWFTDHSAQRHSEAILAHLSDVLSRVQHSVLVDGVRLTHHEVLVLLCAAYLHDIGMQHMGEAYIDRCTHDDFVRIRDEHPAKAAELILERSLRPQPDQFVTGLERDAYLTPIALVAMAHGTSYFEGAVAELRALSDSPGNEPLRGPLLAALLLIGDELDLHEDRASFPPEMRRSPEADLHHYVHHYISRVQVVEGATPQVRRICLTFKFPAGADYAAEVEEWVAGKLHKQCNLTSDIIWTSTKGELQWDDRIFVKTTSDAHGVKGELPDESRSVLRGILARTRVVDRDGFIDEVDSFLRCPEPRRIDIVEEPNSDLECLLDWVLARSSVAGVPAILISLEERDRT